MRRKRTWLWGGSAIVAIWLSVAVGVVIAQRQAPTAEKVQAFIQAHPIDGLDAAQRAEVIDQLAQKVNRLPMEERQKMRLGEQAHAFYRSMTPQERGRYLDLTLTRGMRQLMAAFNEMSREDRQKIVNEALGDIERFRQDVQAGRAGPGSDIEKQNAEKFINEGLKAYLSEASADTKLDLQPLVEQIQSVMQGSRRR